MYSDAITIEFIAYSNAKEALNSEQLDRMTRLRPFSGMIHILNMRLVKIKKKKR